MRITRYTWYHCEADVAPTEIERMKDREYAQQLMASRFDYSAADYVGGAYRTLAEAEAEEWSDDRTLYTTCYMYLYAERYCVMDIVALVLEDIEVDDDSEYEDIYTHPYNTNVEHEYSYHIVKYDIPMPEAIDDFLALHYYNQQQL